MHRLRTGVVYRALNCDNPAAAPAGFRFASLNPLITTTAETDQLRRHLFVAAFTPIILSAIVLCGLVLFGSDRQTLTAITNHRRGWLVSVAKSVTMVAAPELLIPLAVVAGVVLWWLRVPIVVAIAPFVSLGAAAVATLIGKQLIGRDRPPLALRLATENEPSMPSGHTTDGTAFYVTLALVVATALLTSRTARYILVWLAAFGSIAIGLSRLELGVHWPTDLVVSWMLALVITAVVLMAVSFVGRSARFAKISNRGREPAR